MAERNDLNIKLTAEQKAAIQRYAKAIGMDMSDFVRMLIAERVPGFPVVPLRRGNPAMRKGAPSLNPEHQKNLRRKQKS